ncbi:MAG: hypothetical protein K2P93_01380 [Alphaproteobacteria bacterium]|nr:hypothetical protein [Alphaproteobacteria bacterium]
MGRQCYFMDHTFIDAYQMAKLSAKVEENRGDFHNFLQSAMLLRTCHRVEFYFNENTQTNPFKEVLGYDSYNTHKDGSAFLRLVEIACGVQSKIIGEKYIFEQVKKSADELDKDHPFKKDALEALSIARELREKNSFYAPIDYEQIVSRQLSSYLKDISSSHKLLVVGSGMLAKSIISHALQEGKIEILMVSRVAKKIKKKADYKNSKLNICSVFNIPDHFISTNFHCFLATTNINEVYKEKLLSYLNRKECLSIVDMSSLPAFNESDIKGKDYITMYHETFRKYVDENNDLIKNKLENIRREIVSKCKRKLQ